MKLGVRVRIFHLNRPVWVLALMALVLVTFAVLVPINGQAGEGIGRFFGRFHVLILHFPVTLLILAPCLSLASRFKALDHLTPFTKLVWWLGSISVFITVNMGLLLAANEGYRLIEVRFHLLGGVSVALLAFIATA